MSAYQIFSFVGSCAGENSHTKIISDRLAETLIQKAGEQGDTLVYECITGDQLRIDYCRSCRSCFLHGSCPLDQKDDMPLLKQKFLDADIIFFCTPIYFWEMSGIMKSVLDRLSYWSHRLELAGKTGVGIASTDTTQGPDFTERFQTLLQFTGMTVTDTFTVMNKAAPCLDRPEELNPLLDRTAQHLLEALKDPASFVPEIQEKMWKSRMLMNRRKLLFHGLRGEEAPCDVRISEERKMDEYLSFADYVRDRQKKQRTFRNQSEH